jgi:integrase
MSRDEVKRVLANLEGTHRLVALLQYGCGLRLLESLRLRIKDIEWDLNPIVVREGKGNKDRRTMLPKMARNALEIHLVAGKQLHESDRAAGGGDVDLPNALNRELPGAAKVWEWQSVFPASRLSVDPRSGAKRRHHLHESGMNRELGDAVAKQA